NRRNRVCYDRRRLRLHPPEVPSRGAAGRGRDRERAMASTPGPTFGELLRRHRRAAGLTQDQLAERAGLSVRGISDLERGRRPPRRDGRAGRAGGGGGGRGGGARLSAPVGADVDAPPGEGAMAAPSPPARTRHNLPAALTSFVGRAAEVAALQERLGSARL